MSSPFRRVARRLKRIVVGRTASWQAAMADRFQVGEGSRVSRELIVVRDARGCHIEIGRGSNVQGRVVLERRNARIRIGARTHIGGGTLLDAAESIVIGDDVLLSFDVLVMDHDSHALAFADRKDDVAMWMRGEKNWDLVPRAGVQIGNKAWIGARAIILKGVTIGEGAVVGAGTIVTRSVPAWSVVAGNPGRIIRQLDPS